MKSVVWMAAGLLWLHSGFAQEVLDYKIAALDILVIDVVNERDLPKEFKDRERRNPFSVSREYQGRWLYRRGGPERTEGKTGKGISRQSPSDRSGQGTGETKSECDRTSLQTGTRGDAR